jgi:hypothetical protein
MEMRFLSIPDLCGWCFDATAVTTTKKLGIKLCNECVGAKVVVEV